MTARKLSLLWFVLCTTLLLPGLSDARNGDDWVLVERFNAQMKKARAGNANAMYEIARMYERGRGTAPDIQKAVQWFEKAIARGQNDARAQLGVLYLSGRGVRKDLPKALGLLQPAAKKGNATAQYQLAQMYQHGEGVRHDLNQAMYWYKQAASNGYYLAVDKLKTLQRHLASVAHVRQQGRQAASDSPAQVLMRTVLQAKWQHAGRPSGFLPSATTRCQRSKGGQSVVCQSGNQERKSYDAVIGYSTRSTLSGFNNADVFQVQYVNTVLNVKPIVRRRVAGDTSAPRRPPNIPLGSQARHQLHCELKSVNRLVCTKDNNVVETYTRAK